MKAILILHSCQRIQLFCTFKKNYSSEEGKIFLRQKNLLQLIRAFSSVATIEFSGRQKLFLNIFGTLYTYIDCIQQIITANKWRSIFSVKNTNLSQF